MSFITKTVSNYRTSQSLAGKIFIGISGVSALLAAWNYIQSRTVEGEFETRKSQLSKPIYKLTEEEMINPPWNESNLDQWLYRRVEVTGRPIHKLQCMIPREVSGKPGFECIVPLVARQNNDRTEREGILFSRGFIPEFFRPIGNRYKFEDVSPQTFVGFVSTLPELKNHGIFEGNAVEEARLNFTNSNLDDLAKGTGLKNYKQARVAIVERLYETGLLNERHGQRYNHDADQSVDYPYYKTEAGALQLPMNPWDYKNKSFYYFGGSLASFIVGASLF